MVPSKQKDDSSYLNALVLCLFVYKVLKSMKDGMLINVINIFLYTVYINYKLVVIIKRKHRMEHL